MLDFQKLSEQVIAGQTPPREQALAALKIEDHDFSALFSAAWQVRYYFHGKRVNVQVLSNAKSGLCPEDCHYCSQSHVSQAEIARYPVKSCEVLVNEARAARKLSAGRFCMGLSGRTLTDSEVDVLCKAIQAIKAETNIPICCSLGFLSLEQARRLRAAGLDRVNHNLNTSERYYPSICTTHTFADRVRNLTTCREAGLEICSGGIIGQGESDEDIVDMLMTLQTIRPESLPVNFLIPVEGTPFSRMKNQLTPMRCLKVLAVTRLLHPTTEIRIAGGREWHLRSLQPMALFLADSIFVNGYLTEGGQSRDEAFGMIHDLGFEVEKDEGAIAQV
jgi:biotin synthase